MSNPLLNLLKATPLVLGATVLTAQASLAAPKDGVKEGTFDSNLIAQALPSVESKQFNTGMYNQPMSQVTSVNQLRDVEPTAWAFEALRSLVERYGCIVGYPDRTFRGDRALTRWEFAAGLNACLNKIESLIQENVAVLREDIDKLKRLAKEFESELAALGARVDNLEERVSFLEDHQFSTTTKLRGEVVFAISDVWGDAAFSSENFTETAFNYRVRLNFETSFTGKDLLRTRLQAGNFNTRYNFPGTTETNTTRLAFDDGTSNNVTIDDLWYRSSLGGVTFWIGANSLSLDDVFYTNNPLWDPSSTGALQRLQRYNSLVYRGPDGAGIGVRFGDIKGLNFTAAYLANSASNPVSGEGLFDGGYSAGAQLGFGFWGTTFAATYIRSYQNVSSSNFKNGSGLLGGVSSLDAEFPFGNDSSFSSDRFGLEANVRLFGFLNLSGWGGYAQAYESGTSEEAELWTWNGQIFFADVFGEGYGFGVGGGMPPQGSNRQETSYIAEIQFRLPITDNILLTPGAYAVFNPEGRSNNDTQIVGVIRSTFKF
jgi:hypothetical protein